MIARTLTALTNLEKGKKKEEIPCQFRQIDILKQAYGFRNKGRSFHRRDTFFLRNSFAEDLFIGWLSPESSFRNFLKTMVLSSEVLTLVRSWGKKPSSLWKISGQTKEGGGGEGTKKKGKPGRLPQKDSGSVLLSHNLAVAVSSALEGLTAVFGMGTGGSPPAWPPERRLLRRRAEREESAEAFPNKDEELRQAARPISTGTLKPLQALHVQPINLVVYQGSSGRLRGGISYLEVGFPLRCFQQFSRPDIATRPAVGTTAGTLEVSPSRSSRTRDRSSQISNAHNR